MLGVFVLARSPPHTLISPLSIYRRGQGVMGQSFDPTYPR